MKVVGFNVQQASEWQLGLIAGTGRDLRLMNIEPNDTFVDRFQFHVMPPIR